MTVRKGTQDEVRIATEVLAWLPRPIYDARGRDEGMVKDGPGATALRKYNLIGYASLLTISRSRESRGNQFSKLRELHVLMEAERRSKPAVAREPKYKCAACDEFVPETGYDKALQMCEGCLGTLRQEESKAVVEGLPDFTEWSEKLDATRAMQVSQGALLVDIKGMMEKLMKELGVKL